MKRISAKKIMLILFIAILVLSISTVSFATLPDIKPVFGAGASQVNSVASIVLGIVQVIAVAVAVIMLAVLAIKYLSAAPSEKGEIKKGMFTYVVGALLLFAGAGVLNVIKGFANDVNGASSGRTGTSVSGGGSVTI